MCREAERVQERNGVVEEEVEVLEDAKDAEVNDERKRDNPSYPPLYPWGVSERRAIASPLAHAQSDVKVMSSRNFQSHQP